MDLLEEVKRSLARVIDPETGMDVMRMKLVRDLKVNEAWERGTYLPPLSLSCVRWVFNWESISKKQSSPYPGSQVSRSRWMALFTLINCERFWLRWTEEK